MIINPGKSIENVRRCLKIHLVSLENKVQKLLNKPTFKYIVSYNKKLSTVSVDNKVIKFNKNIFVGFVMLKVSKTHV